MLLKVVSILEYLRARSLKLIIAGLRILSLISKGLLLLICSKIFSENELAQFAVILGIANFIVLFSGMDLTRWFQRLVSLGEVSEKITTSIIAHSIFSITAGFILWLVYFDGTYLGILIALYIFLESVSQEIGRQFIILNKQVLVAVLNLWKNLPPFLLVLIYVLTDKELLIVELFIVLMLSSLISLIYGFISMRNIDVLFKIEKAKVLFKDVFIALQFGLYFYVSTILMKSVLTLDKGFVVTRVGEQIGSSYIVWMACFVVLVPLYEIFVGSWSIPRFFEYYNNRRIDDFKRLAYRSLMQCVVLWLVIYVFTSVIVRLFFKEYNNLDWVTTFILSFFVLEYLILQIFGTLNHVLEEKKGQATSSIFGLMILVLYVVLGIDYSRSLNDIAISGCIMLLAVMSIRFYFLYKRMVLKC